MQGVNEIRSLCSQLPLGWWDHLCTLRALPYIPSHLLCPLARSFSLRLTLLLLASQNHKADCIWCAGDQGKPLLSSAAPDLFQTSFPPSHPFPIQNLSPKAQEKADLRMCPPCCMELQLPNAVPLGVAVRAKVSLGGCSPSCSSPEVARNHFFSLKHR